VSPYAGGSPTGRVFFLKKETKTFALFARNGGVFTLAVTIDIE